MAEAEAKGAFPIVLTPVQKEAVYSTDRFLAVVAGPGSGKTRVLTERICHLVNDCEVDGKSILAVSFSSKAAGEVSKRLKESLGERSSGILVSTFHSFGLSLIREYSSVLGYSDNIEIVTPTEKNRIIKKIWDAQNKLGRPCSMPLLDLMHNISMHKSGAVKGDREVEYYCKLYNEELKIRNSVDFDDMIIFARKLLVENDDIRYHCQIQHKYIMVDEVQDMNTYQTDIIMQLVGSENSLFIVGDDDQCIYEWRGAVPDFLKKLASNSEYHVIHLDDNFRSEGAIVTASSAFIQRNNNRIRKNLQAKKNRQRPETTATTYAYRLRGIDREAGFIARTIQQLVEASLYQYSDFTILVRKHSQEGPIAAALEDLEIPYHIQIDDVSQFDEFLFFLKALVYMDEKNNMSRAINYPSRIIDNFTYEDLCNAFPEIVGKSIPDTFQWLHDNNCQFDYSDVFHSRYDFLLRIHKSLDNMTVTEVVNEVYQYYTTEEKLEKKNVEKLEKTKAILPIAEDYDVSHQLVLGKGIENIIRFLDYLNLSEQDDSSEQPEGNAVNIMTCHRSKGLEFPVVFIPGVQVSLDRFMHPFSFISGYYTVTDNLLEAERRLFYVAMTRAIDRLYITCSSDPFCGNGKAVKQGFLAEIPGLVLHKLDEDYKEEL